MAGTKPEVTIAGPGVKMDMRYSTFVVKMNGKVFELNMDEKGIDWWEVQYGKGARCVKDMTWDAFDKQIRKP